MTTYVGPDWKIARRPAVPAEPRVKNVFNNPATTMTDAATFLYAAVDQVIESSEDEEAIAHLRVIKCLLVEIATLQYSRR